MTYAKEILIISIAWGFDWKTAIFRACNVQSFGGKRVKTLIKWILKEEGSSEQKTKKTLVEGGGITPPDPLLKRSLSLFS